MFVNRAIARVMTSFITTMTMTVIIVNMVIKHVLCPKDARLSYWPSGGGDLGSMSRPRRCLDLPSYVHLPECKNGGSFLSPRVSSSHGVASLRIDEGSIVQRWWQLFLKLVQLLYCFNQHVNTRSKNNHKCQSRVCVFTKRKKSEW